MHYRWVAAATLLLTAPCAAHAQPTLEQRVERMEAESDIRRMLIEYGKFLDAKDFASYEALFAEDGVWTGGFGSFSGPEAIRAMLEANLGVPERGFVNKSNFHMMTNPLIEIDGDRARVESKDLFWTRSPEDRPAPLLAGRYVDEFVKEGGEWKIARRTTWGVIPFRDPNAPPRTMQKMAETMPNARYVEIKGAGHLLPNERPGEINRLVADFLRGQGRNAT